MVALTQEKCEACRVGAPQVSEEELAELIRKIPDWNIELRDGIMQLEKSFSFTNFIEALAFTNQVAELAEAEGHHPALLTEWAAQIRLDWPMIGIVLTRLGHIVLGG